MDHPHAVALSPGTEQEWLPLYRIGAIAAFTYLALMLLPLGLMIAAPLPPMEGGGAVLDFVNAHRAVYIAELLCFVGLCIPAIVVFLALGIALRGANPSLALLGSVLGISSEVAAFALGSSPPSLSWALAEMAPRYARAVGPARDALASGAEALVAGANAANPVGVLTALGILVLSMSFAKGGLGRAAALVGIITGAAGIMLEALRPYIGGVYSLYGILLIAWSIIVGLALARKARIASSTGSMG